MLDATSKGNKDRLSGTSLGGPIGLGLLNGDGNLYLDGTQSKQLSPADALHQSLRSEDSRRSPPSASQVSLLTGHLNAADTTIGAHESPLTELTEEGSLSPCADRGSLFAGHLDTANTAIDAYESPLTVTTEESSQPRSPPPAQIVPVRYTLPQSNRSIGTGLFTQAQVLAKTLPAVTYMRKPQKTDGEPRRKARTPEFVVTWDNFVLDVNAASWQDELLYPPPTLYDDFEIDNEKDIEIALHGNVFRPLKSLLPQTHRFGRHNSFDGIIGEPDTILVGLDKLYLAVEVKTKWVLSTDDMVATFSQNVRERQAGITATGSVYDALRQIFGYLSYNRLRYGVLTTYDQTWFLYRPPENPGELRVSPSVQHDQSQPTLLQCFSHIIRLALTESKCDSAPPSPPLPQNPSTDESQSQDDDNSKDPSYKDVSKYRKRKREEYNNVQGNHSTGGNHGATIHRSMNMPNQEEHMDLDLDLDSIMYDPSSFDVLSVLGCGRSGTVFEAVLYGKKVALKICDLWQHPRYEEEMLNEITVYRALQDLQGKHIPILESSGYTDGGMLAIATEIAGKPIDSQSLSDEERKTIREALASIHRCGYAHNDIREQNILIQQNSDGFDVRFIDFTLSTKGNEDDFRKERALLAHIIGRS